VQHSWFGGGFPLTDNRVWITLPNTTVAFTSEGGPLLIVLDLTLYSPTGPQYFSCRPVIDDRWAGDYGGYPVAEFWFEGVNGGPSNDLWLDWEKTRVYTGVPAGNHTLAVQCLKYYQYSPAPDIVIGSPKVVHSLSVIELH
jgi:hypothetical protein